MFDAILEDVSAGVAVRNALTERQISGRQFYAHLNASEEAVERYARAKDAALRAMADEIVALADECRIGTKTTTKADGSVETVQGDMVERTRLQIDSRKWLLSKLAPKVYGDKVDHELKGSVSVTLPGPLAGV